MQPPQGPRLGSLAHAGTVMASTYRATTHDGFITPKVIRKQKVIRASFAEYCVMSLAHQFQLTYPSKYTNSRLKTRMLC